MKYTRLLLVPALLASTCFFGTNLVNAQTDVIAFWDFEADYDFDDGADGPNKQDFLASNPGVGIDNTVSGNANLQAFLGEADELDDNGGGGSLSYTSPVSGVTFGPSRTIKWDDLRGGGVDFDIAGQTEFNVIKGGDPVELDDFGNDALLYITLDGTGFQDLQLRFDIEGTPTIEDPDAPGELISALPDEFDVFYRTTGPTGTWFRDINNFELSFSDLSPVDPDNQVADTGYISLGAALDNQAQIEIIINDFDNNGDSELEIDNIEIVGNVAAVPEPSSASLLMMVGMGLIGLRRRNR